MVLLSKERKMTLEKASELVAKLRPHVDAYQLFAHFVGFFKLNGPQQLLFAKVCGIVRTLE